MERKVIAMKLTKHIILIGFMGAGKTTVGSKLADKLSYPFFDTDKLIVDAEGISVDRLFAEKGEEFFRLAETGALKKVINNPPSIIATGGGIVLSPINRDIINSQHVVLLDATSTEIIRRIGDSTERPLIKGDAWDKINTLLRERNEIYKDLADIIISTDNKSIDQITDEIIASLHLN